MFWLCRNKLAGSYFSRNGGFPPDMERVRAKPTPLNLDPGRIRRGGLAEAAYADENGTLPPDAFTPPG